MYYNKCMGKRKLEDSEARIEELEELYVLERNRFLDDFDDMSTDDRTKVIRQLRGILDDIAKEAGGRVKRQENINTFGTVDNSFMELIAGVRGNLPEPEQPVIDVMPVMAEQVIDGEEVRTESETGNE